MRVVVAGNRCTLNELPARCFSRAVSVNFNPSVSVVLDRQRTRMVNYKGRFAHSIGGGVGSLLMQAVCNTHTHVNRAREELHLLARTCANPNFFPLLTLFEITLAVVRPRVGDTDGLKFRTAVRAGGEFVEGATIARQLPARWLTKPFLYDCL